MQSFLSSVFILCIFVFPTFSTFPLSKYFCISVSVLPLSGWRMPTQKCTRIEMHATTEESTRKPKDMFVSGCVAKTFPFAIWLCLGRVRSPIPEHSIHPGRERVGWDSRSALFKTMMMVGGVGACGRQWRWQLKRGGRKSSAPKLASINHRVKFQRRQSRHPCQQWRNEKKNVQVIRVECIAIYSVFKRKTRLSHVADTDWQMRIASVSCDTSSHFTVHTVSRHSRINRFRFAKLFRWILNFLFQINKWMAKIRVRNEWMKFEADLLSAYRTLLANCNQVENGR